MEHAQTGFHGEWLTAEELKSALGVYGVFYSFVHPINSQYSYSGRVALDLILDLPLFFQHPSVVSEYDKSTRTPDLMVLMMNPGASRPLEGHSLNQRMDQETLSLRCEELVFVPTVPDRTQYQIVRFMRAKGFRYARVLNLSDLRTPKSPDFVKQILSWEREGLEPIHSLFHVTREEELHCWAKWDVPWLLAWGKSTKLSLLVRQALPILQDHVQGSIFGVGEQRWTGPQAQGNSTLYERYAHPLPQTFSAQKAWFEQVLQSERYRFSGE